MRNEQRYQLLQDLLQGKGGWSKRTRIQEIILVEALENNKKLPIRFFRAVVNKTMKAKLVADIWTVLEVQEAEEEILIHGRFCCNGS